MILEVGKFNIKAIKNVNDQKRDTILIYQGMNVDLIYSKGDRVYIGYNELIETDTIEDARTLVTIINAVIVKGQEAEDVIENLIATIQNVFFQ